MLEFLDLPNSDIRFLKMVFALPFSAIIKLIEEYYKIKVEELHSGKNILKIREIVNAFKHKKGFKDFRKIKPSKINIELYGPEFEEAYEAIKQGGIFIKALWAAIEHKAKTYI